MAEPLYAIAFGKLKLKIMDTIDQNQINENEVSKMELEKDSIKSLNEIRKWTSFFAILGFIFIGLMLVVALSFGSIYSQIGANRYVAPFPTFLIGFIYIVFGIIYFFPILYLYRFSSWTRKALILKSTSDLNLAFRNLKRHYRYMGIITIIILGLYVLVLIGFLIGKLLI